MQQQAPQLDPASPPLPPCQVYICACTYFALFRMTAFNYNKLIARASTGEALMQNGTLMCRFAAPVCWNFLHMIRMYDLWTNQGMCWRGGR